MYVTPIFGLQAPDDANFVWETAAMLRANADALEAALKRGGIAPVSVQELTGIPARVTALEAPHFRQVLPLRADSIVTFTNFGAWQPLSVWTTGSTGFLTGCVYISAVPGGFANGIGHGVATIPAALKPKGDVMGLALVNGNSAQRLELTTSDGQVKLNNGTGGPLGAGTWAALTAHWNIAS